MGTPADYILQNFCTNMLYIHTSQIALLHFVSPFVQFCIETELHVYQACLETITVIDNCCDCCTVPQYV